MSRGKSKIWLFFEDVKDSPGKVKCNQCQAVISRGGVGKTANNSSMTTHIKYKHSGLVSQLRSNIKSVSDEPVPSTSSTSAQSSQEHLSKQSIQECLAVQWSLDDSRSFQIHLSIAKMVSRIL